MINVLYALFALFALATLAMVVRSDSRAEREMFALRLVMLAATWALLHFVLNATGAA